MPFSITAHRAVVEQTATGWCEARSKVTSTWVLAGLSGEAFICIMLGKTFTHQSSPIILIAMQQIRRDEGMVIINHLREKLSWDDCWEFDFGFVISGMSGTCHWCVCHIIPFRPFGNNRVIIEKYGPNTVSQMSIYYCQNKLKLKDGSNGCLAIQKSFFSNPEIL